MHYSDISNAAFFEALFLKLESMIGCLYTWRIIMSKRKNYICEFNIEVDFADISDGKNPSKVQIYSLHHIFISKWVKYIKKDVPTF